MLTKFNRLIIVLLVVAIALYIVLLNNDSFTVYLTPGSPIEANAGAILIGTFVLGMLFCALIALWFGIKSYFRERGLKARDRQRQAFYELMLKARSHLAAHEWGKARELWEQSIKKDPTDIIARIELSRSIEGLAGDKEGILDSLRVLEAARAADPRNTEILFRAAELNLALQNRTAALDNLALILYHHPNYRAARLARDISEELGRIGDAFEYQKQVERLAGAEDEANDQVLSRLNYLRLLQDTENDPIQLREALRGFTKKNPAFAPALMKLAEIELAAGKHDEAAQLYVKASRSGGDTGAWHLAARIWLKAHMPEKAIAAAKVLASETTGQARITAEIELIRLYIALNMLDEARKLLEGFPFLLKRENVPRNKELMLVYLSLKGLCLSRMGEHQYSSDVFKRLCELDMQMQDFIRDQEHPTEAPAPRLSTP